MLLLTVYNVKKTTVDSILLYTLQVGVGNIHPSSIERTTFDFDTVGC